MTLFGRLDVRYPDGRSESHQLHGKAITVGSARDNMIQLDHDAVSMAHFRLDVIDGVVFITDTGSEQGAIVAGRRLAVDSPLPLRDTETISIGPLRLTFYHHRDSPTISMPAFSEKTQPAAVGIRASLDQTNIAVFPASSVTIPLSISNTSNTDAEFRIEASGLPEDWLKPTRLVFPLPAREDTQILFLVKPARRADIPPQELPLTFTITRLDETQQALRLIAVVKLGGFNGLSLALELPGEPDRDSFELHLLNQGNEALSLALDTWDPQSRLDLRLAQSGLKLSPGGRGQVGGVVRSQRRPLIGRVRAIPYALVAKAEGPSQFTVAVPAQYSVKPYLSPRSALLALATIIALILVAASILIQAPKPAIASFSLSAEQVAQGTPVELSWIAEHADRYVIEVDRVAVVELAPDRASFKLETGDFSDPVDIALIAQQGKLTEIESRRLDVYQPVVIRQFYTDRSTMLRKVSGTLRVRWAVDGAVSLDLARPLGFETVSESRVSNASGEYVLRGAPVEDFEIMLTAADEIGTVTQERLLVAIRDPECTPVDDITIYAGPDTRYDPVKIAVAHVPVLVHGADASRDWLNVELASGQSGWGFYNNFLCPDFEPAGLEVISDVPPLPTPTDTPAPTVTATASITATASAGAAPSLTPTGDAADSET